jgi:hypothetical protein
MLEQKCKITVTGKSPQKSEVANFDNSALSGGIPKKLELRFE